MNAIMPSPESTQGSKSEVHSFESGSTLITQHVREKPLCRCFDRKLESRGRQTLVERLHQ